MSITPDPASPTTDPTTGSTTGSDGSSGRPDKAHDPLRSSRTSGLYTGVIALGILLILLIIFIVQNTETASVRYLGFEGSAPQSVLLLIAVAAGILLTAIAGSLRLLQVRRRVKRERKR